MKHKNRIWKALIFTFIVCLTILMPRAASNKLTIKFENYDTEFKAYRVQTTQNGNFVTIGNYADYDLDYDNVEKLALTLEYITNAKNIKEDYSGITENGILEINNVTDGVYLILGKSFEIGNKKIIMMPVIITITKDETVIPKYEEEIIEDDGYELTVYKTWVDSESSHPEIIAQLFNDNGLVTEVSLNAGNGFRHTFKNLDKKQNYYVVEKVVPEGYTVSISKQDNTIIIKNAKTEISPLPPEKNNDKEIPQTGQLWWPLPYIALIAVIFGILTFKTKYKKIFVTLSMVAMCCGLLLVFNNMLENFFAADTSREIVHELKEKIEKDVRNGDAIDITGVTEIISKDEILEMPTYEIDGISCVGIIEIPAVSCSLPIAKQWSYDVLKKMPGIYYGNYYNDTLIVAGHNYRTGQFGVLKNVKLDDSVFLTNVDGQIFEYKVALIEVLGPKEVEKLKNNDYDLSLFTCTSNGSKRLVLRCEREKYSGEMIASEK